MEFSQYGITEATSLVRVFLLCLIIFMLNLRERTTGVSRENPQGVGFFFRLASNRTEKKNPTQEIGFHQLLEKS